MVQPKLSRWDKMRRHPVIHSSHQRTWTQKTLVELKTMQAVHEVQVRWIQKVNDAVGPVHIQGYQSPVTGALTLKWEKDVWPD